MDTPDAPPAPTPVDTPVDTPVANSSAVEPNASDRTGGEAAVTLDPPRSVDELRQYVHARLCAMESLLEDQFRTLETPVLRRGEPCGLQWSLRGPRSVRLGAVWASDKNELYVYDAQGRRAEKLNLPERIAA